MRFRGWIYIYMDVYIYVHRSVHLLMGRCYEKYYDQGAYYCEYYAEYFLTLPFKVGATYLGKVFLSSLFLPELIPNVVFLKFYLKLF
jgi:hypothetical protein